MCPFVDLTNERTSYWMIESYFKVARKKKECGRASDTESSFASIFEYGWDSFFFFRNKSDIFTNIYLCLSLVFNIKPKMAYFLS